MFRDTKTYPAPPRGVIFEVSHRKDRRHCKSFDFWPERRTRTIFPVSSVEWSLRDTRRFDYNSISHYLFPRTARVENLATAERSIMINPYNFVTGVTTGIRVSGTLWADESTNPTLRKARSVTARDLCVFLTTCRCPADKTIFSVLERKRSWFFKKVLNYR